AADVRILSGAAGGPAWTVSANIAGNRNRIVSLGATQQQFSDRLGAGGGLEVNPFIQKPGLPIGTIWGYQTDGIFRDTAAVNAYKSVQPDAQLGDYRYKDLNGDGHLTDADKTMIGNVNPDYVFGITNRVTFGRFDFSALIQGVHGNNILNANRLQFLALDGFGGNIPLEYYRNAFDPVTNPNGKTLTFCKQPRHESSSSRLVGTAGVGVPLQRRRGVSRSVQSRRASADLRRSRELLQDRRLGHRGGERHLRAADDLGRLDRSGLAGSDLRRSGHLLPRLVGVRSPR